MTYRIWKGTETEYKALHTFIARMFGRPPQCESCGTEERKTEWANISGEYRLEREDWERLCRRCHMHKDGRAFSKPATGMKHTEKTKAQVAETMRQYWAKNREKMAAAQRKAVAIRMSRKTHCINGHEFTEENTHRAANRPGRICRACWALRRNNNRRP